MLVTAQQAQNICTTFIQRPPNVFDVGPTLYNVLYLLGGQGGCSGGGGWGTNVISLFLKQVPIFDNYVMLTGNCN